MFRLNNNLKGLALLWLLGFIWGTGYSIARFAMTNNVAPFGYSFWQSLGPAIIITLFCFAKNKAKMPIQASPFYVFCGLTGIVIPNTAMYYAANHLPAGIIATVVNIVPVIVYPLSVFLKIEAFNWQRLIGIFFAISGLMLIVLPKASLPSPNLVPWVLLTLVTPISFAICSIYIARYQPAKTDSLTLASGMLVSSTILLLPMVIQTHSFYFFHWPLTQPDWIILLEILLSSVGYILFFKLIKIAGPVYYSFVDSIVVLTGIFWSYVIFAEELNKWTSTAVLLVLLALALVTKKQGDVETYKIKDLAS